MGNSRITSINIEVQVLLRHAAAPYGDNGDLSTMQALSFPYSLGPKRTEEDHGDSQMHHSCHV